MSKPRGMLIQAYIYAKPVNQDINYIDIIHFIFKKPLIIQLRDNKNI